MTDRDERTTLGENDRDRSREEKNVTISLHTGIFIITRIHIVY